MAGETPNPNAAIPNTAPQPVPKGVPGFAHRYVGNGNMIRAAVPLYKTYPALQSINSVYNLAPASKWALSLIPFVGFVTGSQPIEKVNLNTSGSLAITGFIWTIYAMMITPQNAGSRALAAVNFAMGTMNGLNCYRRYCFDQQLAAKAAAAAAAAEPKK